MHGAELAESLSTFGFAIRSQSIGHKDWLVPSCGDFHWRRFTSRDTLLRETCKTRAALKSKWLGA